MSPSDSSGLPRSDDEASNFVVSELRGSYSLPPLFDLAPDRVCQAIRLLGCWWALTPPFHPYPDFHRGGVFSVASRLKSGSRFTGLSVTGSFGFQPPGVTWYPALRSSDFPPFTAKVKSDYPSYLPSPRISNNFYFFWFKNFPIFL